MNSTYAKPESLTISLDKHKTAVDKMDTPNGIRDKSLPNGLGEPKQNEGLKIRGFRHIVACLALSSIIIANTNRQAYNNSLARMERKKNKTIAPEGSNISIDDQVMTTSMLYNISEAETVTLSAESTTGLDLTESPMNWTSPLTDELLTGGYSTTTTSPSTIATSTAEEVNDGDSFDWTPSQVAALQSAFNYGYMPFMIPGGRLSELYGAKWVVFLSGLGSAICSLAVPFLADTSFELLFVSRIVMGICQTGVSPALYALLARWLTPEESSIYLPLIKIGVNLGFGLATFISSLFPWRITFYIVGFIGIAWSTMWLFLISSDPKDHKLLYPDELRYIQQSRSNTRLSGNKVTKDAPADVKIEQDKKQSKKQNAAPWIRILTNPSVLVFVAVKFTVKMSTDSQTTQIPRYFDKVIRMTPQESGFLLTVNFVLQACLTGPVAYAANELIIRGPYGLTKTKVRRIFQGASNVGMALGYISFTVTNSMTVIYIAMVVIALASTLGAAGEAVVPIDLTNKYSASIMAIANCVANSSGYIVPPIVSAIVGDQVQSYERWQSFWWMLSTILIIGSILFACIMQAEIQEFDYDEGDVIMPQKGDGLSSIIAGEEAYAPVLIEMNTRNASYK